MRTQRALGDTLAQTMGLTKIGEQLRAEYGAVEAPMPEALTALLVRLEPTERSLSCPRCKFTMVKVVHAPGFGGFPSLGGYACPKCSYLAGARMSEGVSAGKH